jgi:iron-sulfur cluster repair protein YtfE (RIC family)
MSVMTDPLRVEHHALMSHMDKLLLAADGVGEVSSTDTFAGVDDVYEFLVRHLLPHARAEDEVMYPALDEIIGAGATATMSRDHVEITRLVGRLGELRELLHAGQTTPAVARDLRRVLYGLHTLVVLHFAKEEECYLPLLDARLDQPSADQLFSSMNEAAVRAEW